MVSFSFLTQSPKRRAYAAFFAFFFPGLDDGHDVRLLHEQELVTVERDLVAGPFAEQHTVARLHIQRMHGPVVGPDTGAHGHDLAFLRLLLGRVGNDDAAGGLGFLANPADNDPVVQRSKNSLAPPFSSVSSSDRWC